MRLTPNLRSGDLYLNLNRFYPLPYCFHCWLWTRYYRLWMAILLLIPNIAINFGKHSQPFDQKLRARAKLANIYLFKANNRNSKKGKKYVQSQHYKHQTKVRNMFKVNITNTRTTSFTSFWCFIVNLEQILQLFLVFLLLISNK